MLNTAVPDLATDVVDNPHFRIGYDNERTIAVVRKVANDPIWVMFSRGKLDHAQLRAAREWQRLTVLAGPRLKSPGHIEEPVDGGGLIRDGIAQMQLDASRLLERYKRGLRPKEIQLLDLVVVQGVSAWEATVTLFPEDVSHSRRRFTGMWLPEILSVLARDMRLAT